ncbi:conserved Plasmodium protein, unknown function [Plasmodium vinckei lentum]|uniref:Uncharacterized protein n=1 Tax=Plasmodium vinckei lentum TaxID=138297 RepID=A0A6V7S047_PLAVN|nr:conserved Plasmodium protein, unknown function [Plasmodium vinckei lentum]
MDQRNSNFVGGKLKLKKKIKKSKSKKSSDNADKKYKDEINKGLEHEEKKKKTNDKDEDIINGTGRIVTIKNTIQGFDTKFIEELKVGYQIILKNPTSLQIEKRNVTSILSNRTILVDEEFSNDISTACKYYINKKKDEDISNSESCSDNETLKYAKVLKDKPKHDVIKIRQKVGLWSYKVVDKKIKGNLTNEQKLDERVKSGRDKFCW